MINRAINRFIRLYMSSSTNIKKNKQIKFINSKNITCISLQNYQNMLNNKYHKGVKYNSNCVLASLFNLVWSVLFIISLIISLAFLSLVKISGSILQDSGL